MTESNAKCPECGRDEIGLGYLRWDEYPHAVVRWDQEPFAAGELRDLDDTRTTADLSVQACASCGCIVDVTNEAGEHRTIAALRDENERLKDREAEYQGQVQKSLQDAASANYTAAELQADNERLRAVAAAVNHANEMYVCPACYHCGSYSDYIASEDHTCTGCHAATYELRYWVSDSTREAAEQAGKEGE